VNPGKIFVAAVTLLLCITSTVSAGYFDFLSSDSSEEEYGVELVTDTPCPDAFLPAGEITALTVVSDSGVVCEKIYMSPNGAVEDDGLEALRDYCQKNRMFLLLDCLDDMDSEELDIALSGGKGMSATANVSQGEVISGKGNFDDDVVFVDDAFFGMKDGKLYIGFTDPFALQIKERRDLMLTCFDMYAANYGVDDYRLEGLDEQIEKLADLEDRAALAPDYSFVEVTYEGDENVMVETPVVGRDQLDPQIYEAYIFEVEAVHRIPE